MNAEDSCKVFLRRQDRHSRGAFLAWAAASAVSAWAWDQAARRHLLALGEPWPLGAVLLSFGLFAVWCTRTWGMTPALLGRSCDRRWGLKGRLEAVAELEGSQTAIAQGVRSEAARALASVKPATTLAWISGLAATGAALSLVAIERFTHVPPAPVAAHAPVSAAPARGSMASPLPPAVLPPGSIQWRSPAPSISAGSLDTVPLVAATDTARGFSSVKLEAAVGNRPPRFFPVPVDPSADYRIPSRREIRLNLYLDELGAKPGDVVSYRLAAETNSPGPPESVTSPEQVVHITPPKTAADGVRKSDRASSLAKKATRRMATLPRRSSTPAGRLESLAGRQAEFNRTLQAAPEKAISEGAGDRESAIARDALALAKENSLTPAVERLLQQAGFEAEEAARQAELGDAAAAREPSAQAASTLQQAVQTQENEGREAAGKALSRAQQELNAADLAQTQAAQKAQRKQAAQELQAEAERQQEQGSAEAAQSLSKVAQQASQGTESASASQPQSQSGSKPSAAPGDQPPPDGASSTQGDQPSPGSGSMPSSQPQPGSKPSSLPGGGQSQSGGASSGAGDQSSQGSGSAGSAQSQSQSGSKPGRNQGEKPSSAQGDSPSHEGQGSQGGNNPSDDTGGGGGSSAAAALAEINPNQAIPQTLRQLADLALQLPRSAPGTDQLVDTSRLEAAAQTALYLGKDSHTRILAQNLISKARSMQETTAVSRADLELVGQQVGALANALSAAVAGKARDEWVRQYNPDEVDPDYRRSVEDYFELLSRTDAQR